MAQLPTRARRNAKPCAMSCGHALLQGTDAGQHDEEADHQRNREAHREQIQRGRGAADHAEGQIDDEQRRDARQRDGNGAGEQLAAPENHHPQAFAAQALRADGQRGEAVDQHLDQCQVAAEREKGQRGENDVELAERGRAAAAQRIDVEGEGQAHAVGQQLAREAQRVEHHLQRKAQCHADQQLLRHHDEALRRERRDARGRRQRHHQRGDGQRPAPCASAWARSARRTSAPPSDRRRCARTGRTPAPPRLRAVRW